MSTNAMRVPLISTGHLSLATRSRIEADGEYNPWLIIVKLETGYMACLDKLNGDIVAVPADLQAIANWARENRAEGLAGSTLWVRLDDQGRKVEELPLYGIGQSASDTQHAQESRSEFSRERMFQGENIRIEWWNGELEEPLAEHQQALIESGFERAASLADKGFSEGELLAELDVEGQDEPVFYRGWWKRL